MNKKREICGRINFCINCVRTFSFGEHPPRGGVRLNVVSSSRMS